MTIEQFNASLLINELLENPDDIEDSMLVAIVQACIEDGELKSKWNQRLTVLTLENL